MANQQYHFLQGIKLLEEVVIMVCSFTFIWQARNFSFNSVACTHACTHAQAHIHTHTHTVTQTTTTSYTGEAEGGAYIIRNILSWYNDVINDIAPRATFTPGHSITSCPQLTRTTLLCWAPVTRKYFNVIILAYICLSVHISLYDLVFLLSMCSINNYIHQTCS